MTTILALIIIFMVAPGIEGTGFEIFGITCLFSLSALYDAALWTAALGEDEEEEKEPNE